MPYLHLETTADLPENGDVPDILEALVDELCLRDDVESTRVRAYHSLRSVWQMGADARPSFAHLTVALMTGREVAIRTEIAQDLMSVLRQWFAASLEAGEVSLTLEVREMDRETYLRI